MFDKAYEVKVKVLDAIFFEEVLRPDQLGQIQIVQQACFAQRVQLVFIEG